MRYIAPLLADLANGIFATLLALWITGVDVVWWYYLIGIMFAMLPDVDAIPELIARRGHLAASSEHTHDHREYLHYPILFLIVGILIYSVSEFWGVFFLLGVSLHFLNDLYGTGWGIPLLWPVTQDRFKLFCDDDNNFSFKPRHFVRRIPHQALQTEITEHGVENWVAEVYLKVSTISVIEYTLFAIAIVLMVISLL
ncbi:metal-dependent hydrolase [Candidatus Pacebacteria bacterium]|nr:metal-dependent hydrolase [Candidatus Paceibacterota bacterium]